MIVGEGALAEPDGPAILAATAWLAAEAVVIREGWNGWNVLHSAAARQRILPLRADVSRQHDGAELPGMPHDGIEPMRRMVRWVIDELPSVEHPAGALKTVSGVTA